MSNIVLELQNINKTFFQGDHEVEVLKNVNLQVMQGEMVGLVGPSGSGKTTLLQIAGLLDNADSGEIIIDSVKCSQTSDNQKTLIRGSKLGFVYQFHNLIKDFSALENVSLPLIINNTSAAEAIKKAEMILEQLGLGHRVNHFPNQVSGGEQQRIAIARALVHNPKAILADEPTGNLDPTTADIVFNVFKETVKKNNTAAIIVTHNHDLASKLDSVYTIKDGLLEKL